MPLYHNCENNSIIDYLLRDYDYVWVAQAAEVRKGFDLFVEALRPPGRKCINN